MVAVLGRRAGSLAFSICTFTLIMSTSARNSDDGTTTQVMKAICSAGIWNLVNKMGDDADDAAEQEMVRTLQREQVAKYLLAVAYKTALARDGIILEIEDEGAEEGTEEGGA